MKCKFCGRRYKAKLGHEDCPYCGGAYDVVEVKAQANKLVNSLLEKQVKESYSPLDYLLVFLEKNPKIKKIAYSFIIMLGVIIAVQVIGMIIVMGLTLI